MKRVEIGNLARLACRLGQAPALADRPKGVLRIKKIELTRAHIPRNRVCVGVCPEVSRPTSSIVVRCQIACCIGVGQNFAKVADRGTLIFDGERVVADRKGDAAL